MEFSKEFFTEADRNHRTFSSIAQEFNVSTTWVAKQYRNIMGTPRCSEKWIPKKLGELPFIQKDYAGNVIAFLEDAINEEMDLLAIAELLQMIPNKVPYLTQRLLGRKIWTPGQNAPSTAEWVRMLNKKGLPHSKIAKKLNITRQRVSQILKESL